ncbi:sensor histidine kinase [Fodinicurvata sediminis]|uniref:sensor histidine kinase n=1 Tax=Fodinicurvata sediminis TaxID=1121832 RepID=UPI0003B674E9|nr:ATP-binding protein [Fodinicurvata sediminis]
MKRRHDVIAYAVSGIAILAFAVVLVFALWRLLETESEMRRNEGDNMLWAISQAQTATLLLDATLARRAGGLEEGSEVERRYNVLLSRLNLLSQGPQARYMADLGFAAPLAEDARALRSLEDVILEKAGLLEAPATEVHFVLDELERDLGRAANESMVAHWDRTGARLDRQREAILQVIVSILAILALGVFLSVTMLRALAQREHMRRTLVREQEVAEIYRSFVALVSHQFRTPLAVIDSSMQRLQRQGDGLSREDIQERARRTRTEVQGLARLVDTTLDAIRLEGGGISVEAHDCEIAQLLERVRERQLAVTPERSITLSIADEVPPYIRTDPLLVEQILGNLLSNALKYSPESESVSLNVRAEGHRILFSVVDSGIGIPQDEQNRLFSRFFRATSAAGTRGAGIGLSISHQLAGVLGGELSFESHSGLGSSFTLALPNS